MDRNRETVKTISLQRMSLITEIIASLAVVVSILFLIKSINQNTEAMHSANSNFLFELQNQRHGNVTTSSELAAAIVKFRSGEQLSPQEELVYFLHEMQNLNMWEMAFERYNSGVISEQTWNSWSGMWEAEFPKGFPEEWWSKVRNEYGEPFRTYVDVVYAQAGT
jgi:hypothetical protein